MIKNSIFRGLLYLSAILTTVACNNNDPNAIPSQGVISFGMTGVNSPNSRTSNHSLTIALVSVEDELGNTVLDQEELPLISLGKGFTTKEVQLPYGNYKVTRFVVLNDSDQVVYAAPITGSKLAALVSDPLPVHFEVGVSTTDETVPIEVLEVEPDANPGDFGLIDFPIDFIDLFELQVTFKEDDDLVSGTLEMDAYIKGTLVWNEILTLAGSKKLSLFDHYDSVSFKATSDEAQEITRTYLVQDLLSGPEIVFNFGERQSFIIEVIGVDRDVNFAIASLVSPAGLKKMTFEIDAANDILRANAQQIPTGTYDLVISIFEGDNLLNDPSARGSMYNGVEGYGVLDVVHNQGKLIVQGPDLLSGGADHAPMWSERYFHSFEDRRVIDTDLVWSTPEEPCQTDLRFIPENINRFPEFMQVDYFIYDENLGGTTIGYKNCYSNCNPFELLEQFSAELKDKDVLCDQTDWDTADSMMILNFGDKVEDLVVFFMRWDENGPLLNSIRGRSASRDEVDELMRKRSSGVSPMGN